jgi:hypothetical protein
MRFCVCKNLFFKKNYALYLFLCMSIAVRFVSSIFDERIKIADAECRSMKKRLDFAESLRQDPDRLNFVLKHLFFAKSSDFSKFVSDSIVKNNGCIISLQSKGKEPSAGQVAKESVTIAGIFWHDRFVFDFIRDVESFGPGFAKVISIEIEKIGEVNPVRPVISVLMRCEIFQIDQ